MLCQDSYLITDLLSLFLVYVNAKLLKKSINVVTQGLQINQAQFRKEKSVLNHLNCLYYDINDR